MIVSGCFSCGWLGLYIYIVYFSMAEVVDLSYARGGWDGKVYCMVFHSNPSESIHFLNVNVCNGYYNLYYIMIKIAVCGGGGCGGMRLCFTPEIRRRLIAEQIQVQISIKEKMTLCGYFFRWMLSYWVSLSYAGT